MIKIDNIYSFEIRYDLFFTYLNFIKIINHNELKAVAFIFDHNNLSKIEWSSQRNTFFGKVPKNVQEYMDKYLKLMVFK